MKKYRNLVLSCIIISTFIVGCASQSSSPKETSTPQPSPLADIQQMGEDDLLERTAYLSGENTIPSYEIWETLLNRPEIESYSMIGLKQGSIGKETNYSISAATTVEKNGIENYNYQLVDGKNLTSEITGECLVSENFSKNKKKNVGDKITIKTDKAKKTFTICGIITSSSEVDANTEEAITKTVFVTIKDFISLIDKTEKDCILLTDVTCHTAKENKNFIKEANVVLKPEQVEFKVASELKKQAETTEPNIEKIEKLDGTDLNGNAVETTLFGKDGITMINVWATYCNPCIQEMPHLAEIDEEYKNAGKNFTIIGICSDAVTFDGSTDTNSIETAKEIVNATKVNYLNIIPGQQTIQQVLMNVSVVPTTFFVNDKGEIQKIVSGSKSKEEWKEIIDSLLP